MLLNDCIDEYSINLDSHLVELPFLIQETLYFHWKEIGFCTFAIPDSFHLICPCIAETGGLCLSINQCAIGYPKSHLFINEILHHKYMVPFAESPSSPTARALADLAVGPSSGQAAPAAEASRSATCLGNGGI